MEEAPPDSMEDQALGENIDAEFSHDLLEEQESFHAPIENQEHEKLSPFSIHEDKVLVSHDFPQISDFNDTLIESFEEDVFRFICFSI
jgi:hypothetical protein